MSFVGLAILLIKSESIKRISAYFSLMPTDIVFPDSNEADFISMAKRLGYTKLYFAYPKCQDKLFQSDILAVQNAVLAVPKDIPSVKKGCRFVIVRSSDMDRFVIEKEKPSLMFDFEQSEKRDFFHSRNSGLNQVHCELMRKNDIIAGFSFSSILLARNRPQLLGRIMQNIRFCAKYNVRMSMFSLARSAYDMRSPKDMLSFCLMLGMSAKDAKDALDF
jgi:RNase P/RNase MRP subunit p30